MATYNTEIQWGGPEGDWHADKDLSLSIANRSAVVPADGTPAPGTSVSWNSPEGNANITFFDGGTFQGTAQFPDEGPVGYRGSVKA
ncbi:hypothetical protein ACIQGZ_25485 [Streptomyces sp. NPDC092296]|uniref:hypothetical protein n=1 Tax=Streptomyces sp. NPDC092296 TaxID=3366012 RepID=UPI0037FE258A